MRTFYQPLITLFLFITLHNLQAQKWFSKSVNGNGNKTTKVIQTQDYDIIHARGPIDIQLKKGKEGVVEVTTSENLHQYLEVESNGNRLEIRLKRGVDIRRNGHFIVTIPFESLSEISLSGSGAIETLDTLQGNVLEVKLSGSGDIELDLQTEKIDLEISGSGNIKLSGASENMNLNISGSADCNGLGLDTQNTKIKISGSGEAKVVAHKTLIAKISGSGSIQYKGTPEKINNMVSGSGTIKSL